MRHSISEHGTWDEAIRRVAGRADTPARRRLARTAVKGLHTGIFVLFSAGVLETLRAGLMRRPSRATNLAIGATLAEGVVLATNGNRCPLTNLAEELGADHGEVSDIFLPRRFADHIPSICTTMFGLGLGLLLEAKSRPPH